jgi:hypothetical protein
MHRAEIGTSGGTPGGSGCSPERMRSPPSTAGPRSHMADIMTRDVIMASPDSNQLNLMYVNSVREKQQ